MSVGNEHSGKSQIFLNGTAYNTLTKVVGGRALI